MLNIWRPDDREIESFFWDVQVGMRSTILDYSDADRAKFEALLKDADVFFSNKRPGYLERNGLDAETLAELPTWEGTDRTESGLALTRDGRILATSHRERAPQ